MKPLFLFLFFLCFSFQSVYACSCENIPTLCEQMHQSKDDERMLVWIGNLIDTIQLEDGFFAAKFSVVEIISGDIILPDSPLADEDSEYENSDTEIWILGGHEAACHHSSFDSISLFACSYYNGMYAPSICATSYLPVNESMEVSGTIYENDVFETVTLDEVRSILDAECSSNTEDISSLIDQSISFESNVIDHSLNFYFDNRNVIDLEVNLISYDGKLLESKFLNQSGNYTFNTTHLPAGLYIVQFTTKGQLYSRKLVKH